MATTASELCLLSVLLLPGLSGGEGIATYTMADMCGHTISFAARNVDAAILKPGLSSNKNCHVTMMAPMDSRISVTFLSLRLDNCDDHVEIYDGSSPSDALVVRVCGSTPQTTYVTSGHGALLVFNTNIGDVFSIMFTPFRDDVSGLCRSSEFQCSNGRCISQTLYCNDYDNCGDNSDYCEKNHLWWVYMIVAIVASVVIVGLVVCFVCAYCCKTQKHGLTMRSPNMPVESVRYQTSTQTMQTDGGLVNPIYGSELQPGTQPGYPQQIMSSPPGQEIAPPAYSTLPRGGESPYPQAQGQIPPPVSVPPPYVEKSPVQ